MFLVIFGDIHINDLRNIFPYAASDITKYNDKLFVKQ
jgi:hypothetical protein